MTVGSPINSPATAGVSLVALAGNPNCGKTTLFNALTGLRHRVGNYAGVTVERREGRILGTETQLLDLPGTYSLQVRSQDEEIARDALFGAFPPTPERVILVVDATNLERNLYLVTQVLELQIPALLCLNMTDAAARLGIEINVGQLSQVLGIPVAPMVATRGEGLDAVRDWLKAEVTPSQAPEIAYVEPLQFAISAVRTELVRSGVSPPERALHVAQALLSGDPGNLLAPLADHPQMAPVLAEQLERLASAQVDVESELVEARYRWIQANCAPAIHHGPIPTTLTDRVDAVVTHRFWGMLVFLAAMSLMFQTIFTWAQVPMGWIETAQVWLGEQVTALVPPGELQSLLVDGVVAGVGGVVIFMPQIVLLFLFLGLLEDSGYMARAAFVMDRLMSRVGLHGKSFIPLLSSFACAIPGILATRTIENRKDRLVTILVAPLMSCSARLPVYSLLIAGFIPNVKLGGWLSLPALVLVSMYLLGLGAALVMAAVFKGTWFKGESAFFIMELPPYRLPQLKTVAIQTWERASQFLQRAGTVILCISIVLWALMRYPGSPDQTGADRLRGSVAGWAGRALEPVVSTFGMDWKVGIGILGSFAAREVFVTTMAIVYNVDETDGERQVKAVTRLMQEEVRADGSPRFTPVSAAALMVFYVLAMQCVSTLAVVRRETGSWKWPAVQWGYMFVLAWVGATVVFQIGQRLFPG